MLDYNDNNNNSEQQRTTATMFFTRIRVTIQCDVEWILSSSILWFLLQLSYLEFDQANTHAYFNEQLKISCYSLILDQHLLAVCMSDEMIVMYVHDRIERMEELKRMNLNKSWWWWWWSLFAIDQSVISELTQSDRDVVLAIAQPFDSGVLYSTCFIGDFQRGKYGRTEVQTSKSWIQIILKLHLSPSINLRPLYENITTTMLLYY